MPAVIARLIPFMLVAALAILAVLLTTSAWTQFRREYGSLQEFWRQLRVTERLFYAIVAIVIVIVLLSWLT